MNLLENAIIRLLREKPFYGHILLNLRRCETSQSSRPAGITVRDGIPTLAVTPPLFAGLSPLEQQALLEHLVKHLLHLHPLRRKGRNSHDWDLACDLAINPGIEGLPPDALLPEMYGQAAGLAAEEYYDRLVPPFDCGNLQGQGFGEGAADDAGAAGRGEQQSARGTTIDDHSVWSDSDSTPLSLAEEMMRSLARDALRGADGEVPGELREVVERLVQPGPIPWRQVLRQFVATAGRVGRSATWMREHRRFSHGTPGVRARRRLNLLVAVDVSDSTDAVPLREAFAAELLRIARAREASITVLYANSRIQRIESFSGSHAVPGRYDGGGFTDLRPVFEYARTLHPRPAAVVYLTDGVGPAPAEMEFPTLWVLTAGGEKPVQWGVELRLEV